MCHSGLRPGGCKLKLSLCFFGPQILRFAAWPRGPDFIIGITTCHCCRAYDSLISLTCNINTYPPPPPSPLWHSSPPSPSSITILKPSIAILVPSIIVKVFPRPLINDLRDGWLRAVVCPKTQIQKGLELQLTASLDHTQTEVTTKDCHNLKNSGAQGLRPGAQK